MCPGRGRLRFLGKQCGQCFAVDINPGQAARQHEEQPSRMEETSASSSSVLQGPIIYPRLELPTALAILHPSLDPLSAGQKRLTKRMKEWKRKQQPSKELHRMQAQSKNYNSSSRLPTLPLPGPQHNQKLCQLPQLHPCRPTAPVRLQPH